MPNKTTSNNDQLVWMTASSSSCCSASESSDEDKRAHVKVKGSTSTKRKSQIQIQKQPPVSALVISLSTSEDENEAVQDTPVPVNARSPPKVPSIAPVPLNVPCPEVPLPSTSAGNGDVFQENSTKEKETENRPMISRDSDDDSYVTFFDPRVERIDLSWNPNNIRANSSPEPEEHSNPQSPVPSTSKSCQNGKRRRISGKDSTNTAAGSGKNKRRRVEIQDKDDTSDANSSDSNPSSKKSNSKSSPGESNQKNPDRIKKGPERKHRVSLTSTKSKVYKKRRGSARSTVSSSDEDGSESGSDDRRNRKRQNQSHSKPKRLRGQKSKARMESDDDDDDRSSDSLFSVIQPASTRTRRDKKSEKSKAGQRRSRRLSRTQSKKTSTEIALEQLKVEMERKKNKPKRPSPERNNQENNSDESSSSSSSSYQLEIESDASDPPTDFEPSSSSTPSSSSITSGAETDEVPDLESGSEGEKELRKEGQKDDTESGSDEDTEPVSSDSNDGKPPDDGQNDSRCLLCKNLGPANIEGRARERNSRSWCKCDECSIFSDFVDDYDLICCREIKNVADFVDDELEDEGTCVTKHPRFARDVLKNEGYARCISKHREPKRFQGRCQGDFWESYSCGKGDERLAERVRLAFLASSNPEKLWKSLSSFGYWIYGQRTRMVIPACVMKRAYSEFKVPTNQFKPFRTSWKCPIGRHCRLAFDEQ